MKLTTIGVCGFVLLSTSVAAHSLPSRSHGPSLSSTSRKPTLLAVDSAHGQASAATTSDRTLALRGGGSGASLTTLFYAAAVPCLIVFVRTMYVVSISYGMSMTSIGLTLFLFPPGGKALHSLASVHAGLLIAYGVRLASFLLWRSHTWAEWKSKLDSGDTAGFFKRGGLLYFCSILYAALGAPALAHAGGPEAKGDLARGTVIGGLGLAGLGLFVEAVADMQKLTFKNKQRALGAKGPTPYTGGLFRYCRHANYLGEVLFYIGSWVAGIPAIAREAVEGDWRQAARLGGSATLGLAGIVMIMFGATKRLEAKYATQYAKNKAVGTEYEAWRKASCALVPGVW